MKDDTIYLQLTELAFAMFKKTVFLAIAAILSLATVASARPGCPHQLCHEAPPTTGRPRPNPQPKPKPEPEPPVETECIDADGDGEEDDECQSVEVESLQTGANELFTF